MSQAPLTAAAIATALVSEPPRPSVAMRPDRVTPWKPAITAISPAAKAASRFPGGMSSMRALPCASSVMIGTCQPRNERARRPMLRRVMARRPAVTCSPEATTASYSSSEGLMPWAAWPAPSVQATSSLVLPDMAETTTATCLPVATSAATSRPTRRMRSRSATEVPPNFITSRDTPALSSYSPTAFFLAVEALQGHLGAKGALYPRQAFAAMRTGSRAMAAAPHTSIDPAEVERFSAMAAEWWDPAGKFKPLHLFNPVRLTFIRDEAARRFGRDIAKPRPFE